LVRRYQDRLYNMIYRLVGNPEDARDVVQEAFLHAYQSLDRFKGDAQFFTWLYRIAFNASVSQKRKSRRMLSINRSREEANPAMEPEDDSPASRPGHGLEQAEEERRVQAALNQLAAEHRAVLILKDMEDLKYEAIATILQIPLGTVRSRLHRARMELRQLLESTEPKD
jgi:RNA polymerase sigma-70 factor (ECF subfamily)